MIVVFILIYLAAWFAMTSAGTWVFQWGLTEITGLDMPFWPIFWMLTVVIVLIGCTSGAAKS